MTGPQLTPKREYIAHVNRDYRLGKCTRPECEKHFRHYAPRGAVPELCPDCRQPRRKPTMPQMFEFLGKIGIGHIVMPGGTTVFTPHGNVQHDDFATAVQRAMALVASTAKGPTKSAEIPAIADEAA